MVRFDYADPDSADRFLARLTARIIVLANGSAFAEGAARKIKNLRNLDTEKPEKKVRKDRVMAAINSMLIARVALQIAVAT